MKVTGLKIKQRAETNYLGQDIAYFTGKLSGADFQVKYFATVWYTGAEQLKTQGRHICKADIQVVVCVKKYSLGFPKLTLRACKDTWGTLWLTLFMMALRPSFALKQKDKKKANSNTTATPGFRRLYDCLFTFHFNMYCIWLSTLNSWY